MMDDKVPPGSPSSTDGSLKVLDFIPVLEKKLAFLSGARERKRPILTVPSSGIKSLEQKDGFKNLLTTVECLSAQISPELLTLGVIVLADGRHSSSALCKSLLEHISLQWQFTIHHVYLMRVHNPLPLRKNATSDKSNDKLQITYCYDEESLKKFILVDNLTSEFGGDINYDHNHWIYIRSNYEKIILQWDKAKEELPGMRTGLACAQLVRTVKEAEKQMHEHLKLKEIIYNKICDAVELIENFLSYLRHPDMQYISMACTLDYVELTEKLALLQAEIKEEHVDFDKFWSEHKTLLDRVMNFSLFNRLVTKVNGIVSGYLDDLTADLVVGDNLTTATQLGEQHEAFTRKCMETVSGHLQEVKEEGKHLCEPLNVTGEEFVYQDTNIKEMNSTVKKNMASLKDLNRSLMQKCQQKRDLLMVAVKYHYLCTQCERWYKETEDVLATQSVGDMDKKGAVTAMQVLNNCSKKMSTKQITALKELGTCLPEKSFKKKTNKLTDKCKQVAEKLEARKASYLKIVAATMKPPVRPDVPAESIQPVQPAQPVQTNQQDYKAKPVQPAHPIQQVKRAQQDQQAKPVQPVHKSVQSAHQPVQPAHQPVQPKRSTELLTQSEKYPQSKVITLSPNHSVPTTFPRLENGTARPLSPTVLDHFDGQQLLPMQRIFKELVLTEKAYVKDLASVMDGYYNEMDPHSMDVPLKLRGKRSQVFGNLDEIYDFHSRFFLHALEKYDDSPEQVGECFLAHSQRFRLYEAYCKNRSNSNALIADDTACNAFFKQIQLSLGHELPLSSYLLKPVQRITKYQLLLKELMDSCADSQEIFESLKKAFDEMLKILRCLNQSMDVVGLKGFPGNLVDQGRLLAQEKFVIVESNTRARTKKTLFAKNKERHVFLFEKVLVLSKKTTGVDAKKPASFLYKEHYFMTDLSLREINDQKTCLFLMVFGQHKPITLQADSQEVKEAWESEIRRLLEMQFGLLKEQALMSPTKEKEASLSGPFTSTLKRGASLSKFEAATIKPLVTSPTSSVLSEGSPLSDPESDEEEIGFYTDEDDEDGETGFSDGSILNSDEDVAYESLAPGAHKWYRATSDYAPGSTDNDVALVEDQIVELLGISQYGWWWVRVTNHNNELQQGWAPASYLETCSN